MTSNLALQINYRISDFFVANIPVIFEIFAAILLHLFCRGAAIFGQNNRDFLLSLKTNDINLGTGEKLFTSVISSRTLVTVIEVTD